MMRRPWLCGLFILGQMAGLYAADFVPHIFTAPDGRRMPYELFTPLTFESIHPFPLLVFFHGSGDRGSDNKAPLSKVVRQFITLEFQRKHPCFVLVPQCPDNQNWVDYHPPVMDPEPTAATQLALKIMDQLASQYPIDKNRLYIAGLSMGGFAVWDLVARIPERFAAGVACCGGGYPTQVTPAVAQVPIWAFHSADDPTIPVKFTRDMVAAMTAMGGDPKYTELNGLGHASWDRAFAEPGLYDWLFEQRLDQRGGPAVQSKSADAPR